MRPRLNQEQGWALMTVILVMAILMALALPLMTLVDTQQRGSSDERRSEGSFNLAEAALNSTVFILSSSWPASSGEAHPSSCTAGSTGSKCPDSATLASTYQGNDFSQRAWTIRVRDDAAGDEYYDAGAVDANPTWDANGNGKLWVRADGRSSQRTRSVVALIRMSEQSESFPRRVITAGWFGTTNNGNKVIVDSRGDAAEPAGVGVRCSDPTSSSCLGYQEGQVSPDIVEAEVAGDTAVSPAVLDGFRKLARSRGTYYPSSCPRSPSGQMVFIENANCTYGGGGQANSAAAPGMIVVARGTITLGGGFAYYGVVYGANLQRSTGVVVSLGGSSEIIGAVAVDYGGGVTVGSSGRNITFAEPALQEIKSHRTVGIMQGSWRELPGS